MQFLPLLSVDENVLNIGITVSLCVFIWNRYWRRRLGLQVDYTEYEGYRFCYSHRGTPGTRPSVLMLHGFSAHKDMWLPTVKARNHHFTDALYLNSQFQCVVSAECKDSNAQKITIK